MFDQHELEQAVRAGERSVWYRDDQITGSEVEAALDRIGGDRYGIKGRMDRPGSYCSGECWIRPVSGWVALTDGQCPARVPDVVVQAGLNLIAQAARDARLLFPDQRLPSCGRIARDLLQRHTAGVAASAAGWVRHLGRRAVHQGPMLAMVAASERSVLDDRSEAFLHALRVPVGTRWRAVAGIVDGDLTGGGLDSAGAQAALSKAWPHLDRAMTAPDAALPGLIEAELDVHPTCGRMVTLPAETEYGPMYATGHVRGVWTVRQLASEIERGSATVRAVRALIVAEATAPVYEPVYRRISSLAHKPLRKALYTRAWGSLLSGGSITLTPGRPEKPAEGVRVIRSAHTSWWASITPRPFDDDPLASALCRPDHAAMIAGDNDRAVREALWSIEDRGGAVHGVLTDAVMHDGLVALPGWRREVAGRLRQFGTGRYWYGGSTSTPDDHRGALLRWRAMGAASMDLESAERCWRTGEDRGRLWSSDPAIDPNAISRAPELNEGDWSDYFQKGHEIGL